MTPLRRLLWAHPEWWCLAASAGAWALVVAHGLAHWGHARHHVLSYAQELTAWTAMVAAMMLPLVLAPLRAAAFRSLRPRRHRAMALFLVGYFAPWTALGALVAAARAAPWAHTGAAAAAGFALAALWGTTPLHRTALVACHRTIPLAPEGWRADRDCMRFGLGVGVACVASCGALMTACALSGHALPAMLAGAALGAIERLSFRPPLRALLAAHLALAAAYASPLAALLG